MREIAWLDFYGGIWHLITGILKNGIALGPMGTQHFWT